MTDPAVDPNTKQLLELKLPPAEEVYDRIMATIEPDLVRANLPLLTEKYEGESPEDRKARFKRYEEAFAKYEETFNAWIADLRKKYEEARRKIMQAAEAKTQEKEQEQLEELESIFDDA